MAATHTMAQVYALARGAGFTDEQAVKMTAIAFAESGLNAGAVGDENLENAKWGPSIGLWQIRSLNAQKGTGKARDASRLADPRFNARAAREVFRQQGYRAWSVYSSGAYGKYLDAAQEARNQATGQGGGFDWRNPVDSVGDAVSDAASGAFQGLDAVGAFFGSLGQIGTWVRVLEVGGGTVLMAAGLVWIGKDVAGQLIDAAADVVPVGKAAKAAGVVKSAKSVIGQ